jgi:hypothetical protein
MTDTVAPGQDAPNEDDLGQDGTVPADPGPEAPDEDESSDHQSDSLDSEDDDDIEEITGHDDEDTTVPIEKAEETTYLNGLDTSTYEGEKPVIIASVRRHHYRLHPLGVEIERDPIMTKMEAYYFESGDSFNCNERKNPLAIRILTMSTQLQREQVMDTKNKRSPKNAFSVIIQAVCHEYKVKYETLEFTDGSFTVRVVKAFWKIMAGFNSTKKTGINPVLARIAFVYGMIRLGREPYRSNANEFNAGLEAIKSYFMEDTKVVYKKAHPFMLVAYDLLRLHGLETYNEFPLPEIPTTMQQLNNENELNCRVFKSKDSGATFYKESRPTVVHALRSVCERYSSIERKYMSNITEQAKWIANDVPDHVARATPKRKSPNGATSVVKVRRKSLNSANGSLRLG